MTSRGQFLTVAILFEGGLALLAIGLGRLAGIDPLAHFALAWQAAVWGLAAAVPLFGLFMWSLRLEFGPVARIRRFLIETLGPPLAACGWFELLLVSLLVGFGEEVLFRGFLQPWFEQWGGRAAGLAGSNIVFGLAHFITPLYALLAGLMGLYLGWLLDAFGERRLLTPILTHAVYDWLAFLAVARAYRRERPDDLTAEEQ